MIKRGQSPFIVTVPFYCDDEFLSTQVLYTIVSGKILYQK
jgi:hypothetical protein